jgi:hypothetical protein
MGLWGVKATCVTIDLKPAQQTPLCTRRDSDETVSRIDSHRNSVQQNVNDGVARRTPVGLNRPRLPEWDFGSPLTSLPTSDSRTMSSVPLAIQFSKGESPQVQQRPHTGVYGTSPGSGRTDKHQPSGSQAARKLLRRVQWDLSLDEKELTVR